MVPALHICPLTSINPGVKINSMSSLGALKGANPESQIGHVLTFLLQAAWSNTLAKQMVQEGDAERLVMRTPSHCVQQRSQKKRTHAKL